MLIMTKGNAYIPQRFWDVLLINDDISSIDKANELGYANPREATESEVQRYHKTHSRCLGDIADRYFSAHYKEIINP